VRRRSPREARGGGRRGEREGSIPLRAPFATFATLSIIQMKQMGVGLAAFRSIVIAAKAIVLNLLSVGAADWVLV